MKTYFGAIADDFTGATDIAGLLARSGVPVSLHIGVPKVEENASAPFEVIALKSRTAPVERAVAETRQALQWLKGVGTQRFFFKYCSTFDSTPTGNIGPVSEMMMQELNVNQTIYCPAFPENGRSVYMANLFVNDQPLAESPMRHHPLTPMTDSNLVRLLSEQVTQTVGSIGHPVVTGGSSQIELALSALKHQGISHVVVDAITQRNLRAIAQACRDMVLITGGSAVAMPLPDIYHTMGVLPDTTQQFEPPQVGQGALVLSGSCSAMTNAQVARYLQQGRPSYRINPITLANEGLGELQNWVSDQDFGRAPLVYATADPSEVAASQATLGREAAGALIEQALAAVAKQALTLGVSRFVVAGGETSGAVTQALDVTQMNVGSEIAAGVPWCFAQSDGRQMALALKSGNFGDEKFFEAALNALDPA